MVQSGNYDAVAVAVAHRMGAAGAAAGPGLGHRRMGRDAFLRLQYTPARLKYQRAQFCRDVRPAIIHAA